MRILHVTPFYEPAWRFGGMARAAGGLCAALGRRGHAVTVVTTRLEPHHAPDESAGGVRVQRLSSPAMLGRLLVPWTPGIGRALAGAGERFDVAHIHGHRSPLAWSAASLLRRAGVPWVFQPHGTFPTHGRYGAVKAIADRLAGNAVWRGAEALVAVSRAEAAELPRSARVIANGVLEPPRTDVERRRDRLVFVGSAHPQKRADRLPALLRALPGSELTAVGPLGREFASHFGADSARVEVRGTLDPGGLAHAYAESSVLVHPAVGEAFGMVPFEAALMGTPAVVAGDHGCGEWFGAAGGRVVPPDDETALADAVRERLADRRLGESEAVSVAAFCRKHLTWARAAESMEGVYRSLASGRAG